ncbi:CoA-acylating methylmalonate-semialdehyde dehydrogenase [Cellulomonas fengjieae]|uniref:methylmalonate-semialdehyde dehydrogenase (CoA acylating) n=1 Tax=Cellulomonas fengjieae TaxID=2819978 RepID=A0ABS3SHV4_9CELL|nr:CoA-acylating methylmalonate-semialdehyde dehydrogenase [Cellulomonas fengjieae]MBO3085331.1 CoA-acylating methylmalonate-semialdehyde dehydrogenase [Cellulomonas fengjieae]MBO3101077.1 CoA-acylating methylmalonate-semialdehyde dehydrogenase [Cellulomonas fengjieae]QVI66114.1 CoA-acylating methylmalonate-semialdehyde dehydrogenase [Cellulomonas fengjieae]
MSALVDTAPLIGHVVGGRVTTPDGSRTQDVFDPATGRVSGRVLLAEQADVDAAVAAAVVAAQSWSQEPVAKRAAVLFALREQIVQHAEELAAIITAEHGKVLADSRGEIARGLEVIEYACGMPQLLKGEYTDQAATGVDVFSFREPLGVVAGITPFNFPAMVPLWMSPMAIATGNAFVLKPSERDPSASLFLARMWQAAGLPDGVFSVVQGDRVAVDALLTHPDIAAVSFVGSTPIAQHVHATATAHGKRVQALGGAKNHAVVLADADLDLAATHLTGAAFGAAGERCMAISVAVVVDEVADALLERLRAGAEKVRVAPGTDPDSDMGPVITRASQLRIEEIVTDAVDSGASAVVDGRGHAVAGHEDGFFVGPTVLDGVTTDMRAYVEEIFGPVLVVIRAADLTEAIALVNANPYGNGTAIFTSSGDAARTFQRAVNVGMIGINVPIPVPVGWHSFGGWKNSLFGESHIYGPEAVRFYTRGKVVTSRWPASPATARFHFGRTTSH